jgi:Transmembrane family, TMEM144 of transporters
MTVFDGCSDSCGWTAAFLALLCAGTYGVPIKETHHLTEVNPLVFQSFKTLVFFVLSLHVLLLGVPLRFTPWGILSGLLWVLGGTGGVMGVRLAGMAVAVGTWASVMICVNFVWGILIFQEPVANLHNTVAAFVLLGLGLVGMSKFGAPSASASLTSSTIDADEKQRLNGESNSESVELLLDDEQRIRTSMETTTTTNSSSSQSSSNMTRKPSQVFRRTTTGAKSSNSDEEDGLAPLLSVKSSSLEIDFNDATNNASFSIEKAPLSGGSLVLSSTLQSSTIIPPFNPDTHIRLFGLCTLRKRTAGILAALFNGSMSGSALIPMHYARRQGGLGGEHFMVSYGCGALLSNICLWIGYFAIVLLWTIFVPTTSTVLPPSKKKEMPSSSSWLRQALDQMPEWHVAQLWKPAVAAGTF